MSSITQFYLRTLKIHVHIRTFCTLTHTHNTCIKHIKMATYEKELSWTYHSKNLTNIKWNEQTIYNSVLNKFNLLKLSALRSGICFIRFYIVAICKTPQTRHKTAYFCYHKVLELQYRFSGVKIKVSASCFLRRRLWGRVYFLLVWVVHRIALSCYL